MSKFCPNCGAPLNDLAVFCQSCGTTLPTAEQPQQTYTPPQQTYAPPQQTYVPPQQTYTPPQQTYAPPQQTYAPPQQTYAPPQQNYTPPQPYGQPAPKKSKTGLVIGIIAALVVIAGVVALIIWAPWNKDSDSGSKDGGKATVQEQSNPEDAIQLFLEAAAEGSETKLKKAVSQYAWDEYFSSSDLSSYLQQAKEELEDEYGTGAKITVKITESEVYTGDELEEELSYFEIEADDYGITELREVEFDVYVNGELDDGGEATLVKENGVWKIIDM